MTGYYNLLNKEQQEKSNQKVTIAQKNYEQSRKFIILIIIFHSYLLNTINLSKLKKKKANLEENRTYEKT